MTRWMDRLFRRGRKKPSYLWVEACETCHIAYPRWVRGLEGHLDPETRAYSWRGFDVVQDGPFFLRSHRCGRKDLDVAWRITANRRTSNGNYMRHVTWNQAECDPRDKPVTARTGGDA